MNYDSVLNGTVLSNQCNDLAKNLKYEIAFYNSEITADDCNNQAEEYSRMALSCPIGSISDHF